MSIFSQQQVEAMIQTHNETPARQRTPITPTLYAMLQRPLPQYRLAEALIRRDLDADIARHSR